MKSVLISIKPRWCELIANGEKTLEIRKTKPSLKTPFKCYIYCTKDKNGWFDFLKKVRLDGKVIGEFVCDKYEIFTPTKNRISFKNFLALHNTCLSLKQIVRYLNGKTGYGWHISGLKIYDEPKELSEFYKPILPTGLRYEDDIIKRPPQSWCYVCEEVQN